MPNPKGKNQHTPEPDENGRSYVPPKWAHRFVAAYLDIEIRPTDTARCEAAGISRDTLWRAQNNPNFVRWFDEQMREVGIAAATRTVRSALVRMCANGNLDAIRLYLERYDNFIPTQRSIIDGDLSKAEDRKLFELARLLAEGPADGARAKVH